MIAFRYQLSCVPDDHFIVKYHMVIPLEPREKSPFWLVEYSDFPMIGSEIPVFFT